MHGEVFNLYSQAKKSDSSNHFGFLCLRPSKLCLYLSRHVFGASVNLIFPSTSPADSLRTSSGCVDSIAIPVTTQSVLYLVHLIHAPTSQLLLTTPGLCSSRETPNSVGCAAVDIGIYIGLPTFVGPVLTPRSRAARLRLTHHFSLLVTTVTLYHTVDFVRSLCLGS